MSDFETTVNEFIYDNESDGTWENIQYPDTQKCETKSFFKATPQQLKIRIIVNTRYSIQQFQMFFTNITLVTSLISNIFSTEDVTEDHVKLVGVSYVSKKLEAVTFRYKIIQLASYETLLLCGDFNPKLWDHIVLYAKDIKTQTKFILEVSIPRDKLNGNLVGRENSDDNMQMVHAIINAQRQAIHNIYSILNKDKENPRVFVLQRQFQIQTQYCFSFPNVIFNEKFLSICANSDFSEIIVKGFYFYNLPFLTVIRLFQKYANASILFPHRKILEKNNKFCLEHAESPYFGRNVVKTDLFRGILSQESGLFIGCQSLNTDICKVCNAKNPSEKFSVVFSGEQIEWDGTDTRSSWFYHYFTPELKLMDKETRKALMKQLIVVFLVTRVVIVSDVPVPNPPFEGNILERGIALQKLVLRTQFSCLLKRKMKKENHFYNVEVKMNPNTANCFLHVKSEVIVNITRFLGIKDISRFARTTKQMYQIIRNSDDVWKMKYTKLCNMVSYQKYAIQYTKAKESDYYTAVKKEQILLHNWENGRILQKRNVPFSNSPISKICFGNHGEIIVGSYGGSLVVGKTEEVERGTVTQRLVLPSSVNSLDFEVYDDVILVAKQNGTIESYSNDANDTKSAHIYKCVTDEMPLFQRVDLVKDKTILGINSNEVYHYDTFAKRIKQLIRPDSYEILSASFFDEQIVITNNCVGTFRGFDMRCREVVFERQNPAKVPVALDYFGDYVFVGNQDGEVQMFDVRKKDFFVVRPVNEYGISMIDLWNKKGVVVGVDNKVAGFTCNGKWIGSVRPILNPCRKIGCVRIVDDGLYCGLENGNLIVVDFKPNE
ncbi:hypothetical protein EIN_152770 [Entamoeba invadens IP1]|uniref:F-box domain-containing protein n=1 Tax=Entamoeba invadens IP1 TaxID=370355 RepID=A0A0A1U8M4_ENTIV|nr:hypothetical protein EIN_152770 [Entamoeba invadens IP1]ELP91280.1 hypothetical protein EIN_152770 [Entamoeba invadens IP1]|eukprot:XP_004258051.1 hypothetical protein EIN_152770 [Entamoeba invadens IP1]